MSGLPYLRRDALGAVRVVPVHGADAVQLLYAEDLQQFSPPAHSIERLTWWAQNCSLSLSLSDRRTHKQYLCSPGKGRGLSHRESSSVFDE